MTNDARTRPTSDLIITVQPEPMADERDAIVAALAVLRVTQSAPEKRKSSPSRWSMAGRLAAHRGGAISQIAKPTDI
ncbi:MAG: hypothetical protein ACR2LS_10310 [Thermomicrobiales bacterium]